ncbi:MAG: GNAT family N-acetyltransferase [Elusimicrobiota bacterium]
MKIYRTDELSQNILSQVSGLCAECLVYDSITPDEVRFKIESDPDRNTQFLLTETIESDNNALAGFMLVVIRKRGDKNVGWLKLFAVKKEYWCKGVASRLLAAAEELVREHGVQLLRVLDSAPCYFQPGIYPVYTEAVVFLQKKGFKQQGECVHMLSDLEALDCNTETDELRLEKVGVKLIRASLGDKEQLIEWLKIVFPHWIPEASMGFMHKEVRVFLAKNGDGKIIGFAGYDVMKDARFGPLGVDSQYRRHGIGKVLLLKCLNEIKLMGIKSCVIPWTSAYSFYLGGCDAKIWRLFWTFAKEL